MTWLTNQIDSGVQTIVPSYSERLDSHIFTDKVVYRPNDVMFVEVLVLDTFNKTPVALIKGDDYNYNYYLTFKLSDPSGSNIYTSYNYAINGTATFTYKIPSSSSSGEYLIEVTSYNSPTVSKLIRIRDYPRDQLTVKGVLN
jgi:uncharacterized protein YfaS (alpha-2-macroglobulin family)